MGDLSVRTKAKIVDLFAGAGGFSLAAKNAGCDIIFAVENDRHAAKTYRRNLCSLSCDLPTEIYTDDIRTMNPEAVAKKHFGDGLDCDLLLGGPPCQGFSTHRINDSGVDDPRNALIYSYFDFVKALQPRAFLMENVPGLLWPRHAEYLNKFYYLAKKAGYTTFDPCQLDARDYGVPQRRKRVFVLGIKNTSDCDGINWPPPPSHTSDETDDCLKGWIACEKAFAPMPADDPNASHMNHGPELTTAFMNTPANGGSRRDSGRVLPCHKTHDGHKDVYGRIDSRLPAPTMTTACINPSKGRFVHPVENHGITVRQAARIQTFPDNFVFEGGLTAAGKQIGNAVPIKLGEVLIKEILRSLSAKSDANMPIGNRQLEEVY
ncbi:MAG: DNA (cytosine-5-)-methyltransferase [Hyphomicrobiales bacterium]|nr:MAG: DNA (cytosine-5-)-methyltransferase [Hyphomicrobiales bacterium]